VPTYRVGVTLAKEDLIAWQPRLMGNDLFWIEPNSDGMPPSWQDPRFAYCKATGAQPIVGTRVDGDSSKYPALIQHFSNMPSWITTLYVTEHAAPEADYEANQTLFINNYRDWYNNVIQALPAVVRAKVKAGPVVDYEWTEDPSLGMGNYARFDPGLEYSDFFGANFLIEPDNGAGAVATAYPAGASYFQNFKLYRLSVADTRPRLIPKIGLVGIPADTTGTARQTAIQAMYDEMATWSAGTTFWTFIGAAWLNDRVTRPFLAGLGTSRYYQLDIRQTAVNTYAVYAGVPVPPPLYTINQIWIANSSNPSQVQPATPPTPPNPVVPPTTIELPPGGIPVDTPASAALLAADYTILITDANLQVLGDPIHEWKTLQVTIRWKEPGSGMITVPAHQYIRQQLIPGARIVILRRVLGTFHVLLSGPLEKFTRERADSGDNGGVGMLTISFVDDLSWLAARLAFPDPTKPIDQQTTDYWNFSGDPELAMLTLVNTQAGPGALVPRRVPKLVVAAYSGLTGTGTVALGDTSDVAPRERLEKLTDVLRNIALAGANPVGSSIYHPDSLGFRTRQTQIAGQDVILFEPIRSRDLSGEIHFSFGRGNLEYYSFEQEIPSLTHAMVGGQGDGADRFIREIATTEPDSLAWGRFEGYVPQPGSQTLAQATDAATSEMADKLETSRLATNASDTVDQRFGVHYNIGDVVSIELDENEYEIAPIQTINVQAWPTAGEVVGLTIGDQSARYDSAWAKRMRNLERRVGRQERRLG
jgi:hypothetical protein